MHACEPCRQRKTKCSGDRPVCRHCKSIKIQCFYVDGRRDRVKKQFQSLTKKVVNYERVLKDLASRVSPEDAERIRSTTEKLDIAEPLIESSKPVAEARTIGDKTEASGRAGSTGALDRVEEDFTRKSAQSTGFVGKNSDISWIHRLRHENEYGDLAGLDADDASQTGSSLTIHDANYHLNDLSISTDEVVDSYAMPSLDDALALSATYMNRVHPTFPIIGQLGLERQLTRYLSRPTEKPPLKWLAIINLIFAIGAKYTLLTDLNWYARNCDHDVYFQRAKELALYSETIFDHPDLQTIQVFGLMSYYLLAVDQVNRAWQIIGIGVRAATALGLDMRMGSAQPSLVAKEMRYRVWWALYSLEHQLCGMTGRITCISDKDYTTPLPVPMLEKDFGTRIGKKLLSQEYQRGPRAPASDLRTLSVYESSATPIALNWVEEVQPNTALYFLHHVQLCRLTQLVFHTLYSPITIRATWSDVQSQIADLDQKIEHWHRQLPPAFDFRIVHSDGEFVDIRLGLGFFYYATKQMIFRPCLCRLDRKLLHQSKKSSDFNHVAVTTCVASAQQQLTLISDEPDAVGLLKAGPWISILHFLVQCATVLMLELSFRAQHMPDQADDLFADSQKVVRWLHALGNRNLAAARAWKLCTQMLHRAATRMGRSCEHIPQEPPSSTDLHGDDPEKQSNMDSGPQSAGPAKGTNFVPSMPKANMSMLNMPILSAFSALDHFMQYDQYFPVFDVDTTQMEYQHTVNQIRSENMQSAPESDMDFMYQYTDAPGSEWPNFGWQ